MSGMKIFSSKVEQLGLRSIENTAQISPGRGGSTLETRSNEEGSMPPRVAAGARWLRRQMGRRSKRSTRSVNNSQGADSPTSTPWHHRTSRRVLIIILLIFSLRLGLASPLLAVVSEICWSCNSCDAHSPPALRPICYFACKEKTASRSEGQGCCKTTDSEHLSPAGEKGV